MKKALLIALMVFALLWAAWVWMADNMDGLIKEAIQSYGTSVTQVKVDVGHVKLSLADGRGSIEKLSIGNPPGFKTAYALKVAQVELDVDLTTVAQEVVQIRRITIVAPDVIYEKGHKLTNFEALSQNIASTIHTQPEDTSAGKKLIVDVLTIQNAKAQASAAFTSGKTVSLSLPGNITLKNLGRAKGGLTPGELAQEVTNALKSRLGTAAGVEFLMKSSGTALSEAGSTIKGWFK